MAWFGWAEMCKYSVTFTCPATTGWSPCPGRCSTDEAPKNTNTNYLIYSHPNLVNTSYVFLLATEFSLFVVLAFTVLSESVGKKRRSKKREYRTGISLRFTSLWLTIQWKPHKCLFKVIAVV